MPAVSAELFVYLLTGVAGLIVLLTRLRMRGGGGGRVHAGGRWPLVHTVSGVIGLVLWVVFLALPESNPLGSSLAGIVALFFVWLTACAGLLMLTRWIQPRGKHATAAAGDSWSQGPALSVLAHVSYLAIAGYLTWTYLIQVV